MEYIQESKLPLFVRGECSSVLGNVSILYAEKLNINIYTKIMNLLKYVIFTDIDNNTENKNKSKNENENEKYTQNNHEISLFKAKCFESVALVGKSVGRKFFSPIAHEYLQNFVIYHQKVEKMLQICVFFKLYLFLLLFFLFNLFLYYIVI